VAFFVTLTHANLLSMIRLFFIALHSLLVISCTQAQQPMPVTVKVSEPLLVDSTIVTAAERTEMYVPLLQNKRVGIVANQTSVIGKTHLVDSLLALNVKVVKVFAPEHGFRGEAEAGASIKDGKDAKTGLPLISLYGKNKKPSPEMIQDVDVLLFDIQDVGARFYTYISTMHYVMEAAAENNKAVIVLDRPNPNGFYIDGPVLDMKLQSFVGMHPIPIVHGCTVGELANMIQGEGWLSNKMKCDLTVIPCLNYDHNDLYELPIAPSPNLPNMASVYLYPSLCWFEGTNVSVGRGTNLPFQSIGYPGNPTGKYKFTPKDIPGIATNPPHKGQECIGHNLQEFGTYYITTSRELYLEWILGLYAECPDKSKFFNANLFFDKLAGTDKVRKQIMAGATAAELRKSWKVDLDAYRMLRAKYLLYKDYE
jgi:uncharacterized protein YbbC (DUF1343 family)